MLRTLVILSMVAVVLGCPLVCSLQAQLAHTSGESSSCCLPPVKQPTRRTCCGDHAEAVSSHCRQTSVEQTGAPAAPASHSEECAENCLCNGAIVDSSSHGFEPQSYSLQSAQPADAFNVHSAKMLVASKIRARMLEAPADYGHCLRISLASLLF